MLGGGYVRNDDESADGNENKYDDDNIFHNAMLKIM